MRQCFNGFIRHASLGLPQLPQLIAAAVARQTAATLQMLRCIMLYDVRLLFRPYAIPFGELREVRESFSSYNPGLGPRFSSLDTYNIDVASRESQHCSQYDNSCLTTNTYTICDYTVPMATVIDNVTPYTQNTIKSLIRNVYL